MPRATPLTLRSHAHPRLVSFPCCCQQMQKQVEEKRLALEAAYRTGLENLEAAHVSDIDRKKAALDKVVRAKLLEAAQAEGWALEVEPEAASTAGSATGESDPDSVGADS